MKKLFTTVLLGAIAAVAYYAYKNREKENEETIDDKVVYFIDESQEDTKEEKVDLEA